MKATEQLVHDLKKMYLPQNRFANFGNVLLTLDVNGIRGMSASMSMEFPITVIIGKNGSGKSTLAQLALCCYRYKLQEEAHHNMKNYYNLGNFFIKSNLDPNPYTADAYLKYSYAISPESRGFEQMSLFMTTPEASCHARENIIRKIHSS